MANSFQIQKQINDEESRGKAGVSHDHNNALLMPCITFLSNMLNEVDLVGSLQARIRPRF